MGVGRGTAAKAGFLVDAITYSEAYPTTTTLANSQTRVLGAGSLLPILDEDMTLAKEIAADETLDGGAAVTGHEVTGKKYQGGVTCQLTYQQIDELLACALGYEAHYGGAHAGASVRYPYPDEGSAETGTATAGAASTLTDSGKSWSTNEYADYYVRVYEGTGAGQVRQVSSNTATVLTVSSAWTTNPDTDSKYEIGIAWLHHYECDTDIHTRCWYAGEGWLAGRGLIAGQTVPRRGTLCVAPHLATQSAEPKCFEYCATMVRGFTLSINKDRPTIRFDLVSFYRDRDATNQDPTTWTILESVNPLVAFPDLEFRLGDFSTSVALSASDKVRMNSFTLTHSNNFALDDQDTVTGEYIAEPARTGKWTTTGTIVVPRYTSDTFFGKFEDDSTLMGYLYATGPTTIADTYSYLLKIWLRSLYLSKADAPINGPSLPAVTYNFTCEAPSAAPETTAFPACEKAKTPITIRTQNKWPFHAFRQQY